MHEILTLLRVVFSLGVVVLLLWGLSRWLVRRQASQGRAHVPVQVVGRQHLGRNQGVAVLDVGGRLLVVGTAEKSVSLLTELDPEELDVPLPLTPEQAEERARAMAAHPAGWALREANGGKGGEVIDLTQSVQGRHRATTGSVLDPATWQQAARAFRQLRKAQ